MLCYNRESLMSVINTLTWKVKSLNTFFIFSHTHLQYGNWNTLVQFFTATETQKCEIFEGLWFRGNICGHHWTFICLQIFSLDKSHEWHKILGLSDPEHLNFKNKPRKTVHSKSNGLPHEDNASVQRKPRGANRLQMTLSSRIRILEKGIDLSADRWLRNIWGTDS